MVQRLDGPAASLTTLTGNADVHSHPLDLTPPPNEGLAEGTLRSVSAFRYSIS